MSGKRIVIVVSFKLMFIYSFFIYNYFIEWEEFMLVEEMIFLVDVDKEWWKVESIELIY